MLISFFFSVKLMQDYICFGHRSSVLKVNCVCLIYIYIYITNSTEFMLCWCLDKYLNILTKQENLFYGCALVLLKCSYFYIRAVNSQLFTLTVVNARRMSDVEIICVLRL